MTGTQQRKDILVWSLALVGAFVALIASQTMVLELYGKVAWTGVTSATLTSVTHALLNGASIANAVTIVSAFIAGPLAAALTAVGRGMLVTLIKRWGVKKFVAW
ncbi:putative cyclic bacteriocin [Bacillus massilinigeriensis]|uniref:putative cyclic bacteriocin n=1 Tax=Bacillus mediterraneensis TaxID=1805474 RepID=UPI0008F91191|nr:putative cyclic bacteriocin [Bacillus mediterraneensis]